MTNIRIPSFEKYAECKIGDMTMTYKQFKHYESIVLVKYTKLKTYLSKKDAKQKKFKEINSLFSFLKSLENTPQLELLSILDGRLYLLREQILNVPINDRTIYELNILYKEMFYYIHRDMDSSVPLVYNMECHFKNFIDTNINLKSSELTIGYITGFYSSWTYPLIEDHTRLIKYLKTHKKQRILVFEDLVQVCYRCLRSDATTIGVIMESSNFYPELAKYALNIKSLFEYKRMSDMFPTPECVNGIARLFIENAHKNRNNIKKVIDAIISYKPTDENIKLLKQKYNL